MVTKGPSGMLSFINLSTWLFILSDHCTYFWSWTLPSATGNEPGAPVKAKTGYLSGGYL